MGIGQICNQKVSMVSAEASILEVASIMKRNNVGSVVVVADLTEEKDPVGVITDRDIVVKVLAENLDISDIKVEQVMTKHPLILSSKEGIRKAIELMREYSVRRAPIKNESNKIVGIITLDDLLIMISNELGDLARLIDEQIKRQKEFHEAEQEEWASIDRE